MELQRLRVTRVVPGPSGEARFEEVDFGERLPSFPARAATFRRYEPGFHLDFHPSPNRMFVFTLAGEAEVSVSESESRRFGPQDVLLYEDVVGRGHSTRVLGSVERMTLTVDLDQQATT